MGLEVGVTKIADLNSTWPTSTDERSNGDDHLRNIKVALKSLLTDADQLATILALLDLGQPVRDSTYEGTITGSGTAFALSSTPATEISLILFRNGKQLARGVGQDFTIAGANITLGQALEAGEVLEAHYTV